MTYPLSERYILNRQYRIESVLGSGGFGKTYRATVNRNDVELKSRAIKQLTFSARNADERADVIERFRKEAETLDRLRHSQIPMLHDYRLETDHRGVENLYLVMELIQGQTLTELIDQHGSQEDRWVQQLVLGLLNVIKYIHHKGIIHRDIKPDNVILRRDGLPVLIDFGAVKESIRTGLSNNHHQPSIMIGTDGYMPPEQRTGDPKLASDIYSLGHTAIYMLTGKEPGDRRYSWQQFAPNIDPRFAELLNQAIHTNPQQRPTAADMQSSLKILTNGGQLDYASNNGVSLNRPQVPRRPVYDEPVRRQQRPLPAPLSETCMPVQRDEEGGDHPPNLVKWGFLTGLGVISIVFVAYISTLFVQAEGDWPTVQQTVREDLQSISGQEPPVKILPPPEAEPIDPREKPSKPEKEPIPEKLPKAEQLEPVSGVIVGDPRFPRKYRSIVSKC